MNRNFGLDVVRAIAIWLVLLQHTGLNLYGLAPIKIGGVGVEIFFVLSGFLIGGIIFKDLSNNQSLTKTLLNFWIRRWFRILPLYYLALLFKYIFIDHSIGINIFYYYAFLQNNFYNINFFPVSWSLVIEEWFYIFTPIYLFFITRFVKNKKNTALLLALFIVLINITRFFYATQNKVPFSGINGNFIFRFDSLFLGVILAYFKFNKSIVFVKMQNIKWFIFGLTLFLGYIAFLIVMNLFYPQNEVSGLFIKTFGFFILPFTITLTIPFIDSFYSFEKNSIAKDFLFKIITYTSILTYALYLIHPFYYSLIHLQIFSNINYIIKVIVALALTYVTSLIVYNFFEKPILNYRDKLKF